MLDPLAPLAQQLHFINLFGGDETPYESLHSLVSGAVKPWFDAFVGARGGGKDGDSKMGKFGVLIRSPFWDLILSMIRNPNNKEEVCGARAFSSSPATKR